MDGLNAEGYGRGTKVGGRLTWKGVESFRVVWSHVGGKRDVVAITLRLSMGAA